MTTNKIRVEYGFNLNFPKQFTMGDLLAAQAYNAKRAGRVAPQYITIYMRVKKAVRDGVLTVVGKQATKTARRGAKQKIYARLEAAPVAAVTV